MLFTTFLGGLRGKVPSNQDHYFCTLETFSVKGHCDSHYEG